MWLSLHLFYIISFFCLKCTFPVAGKNTEPRLLKDLQIVATLLKTARCSLSILLFRSFETLSRLGLPRNSGQMRLDVLIFLDSISTTCWCCLLMVFVMVMAPVTAFIVTILVVNVKKRAIRIVLQML
jgi:hypothetical protein